MTPVALALETAALLVAATGITLMARPVRDAGPADAPALYRRRIAGAMLIAAALFLGGFTLAASLS